MPISVILFTAPTGSPLLDATPFVESCQLSTNAHGTQAIDVELARNLYDAFRLYDAPGTLHIEVNDGAQILGASRLEDPGLHAGRMGAAKLNALGYQRALSDIPYTALWSDTSLGAWYAGASADVSDAYPDRFTISTEDQAYLQITPQKNSTQGNTPIVGRIMYRAPNSGSRSIIGIQFSWAVTAGSNWQVGLQSVASPSSVSTIWSQNLAAGALSGAVHATFTATSTLSFYIYYNAAPATVVGDTGDLYLRISNIRVVTATTNRVNTTLTANRAAGTNVTATVGSTAGMYVGQLLTMNSGTTTSEQVAVLSIGSSTQFNATFANSYTTGQAVQGQQIYADEIVRDLVSTVSGINSSQLSSATSGITSPGRDIADALYEDQLPDEIITALAATGNSSNQAYEWGVDDQRRVFFRQQGSRATTWYVDIDDLELSRSLDGLYNSGYTVYEDVGGMTVRSAVSTNSTSVLRYGLTRRQAIDAQTSNNTYAAGVRDATIAATVTVQPRASFTVRAVYNSNGARYPISYVRANDIIVIRNLPPTASAAVDTVRTFRISRTVYDPLAGTLQIEPEAPDPTLEALVGGQV